MRRPLALATTIFYFMISGCSATHAPSGESPGTFTVSGSLEPAAGQTTAQHGKVIVVWLSQGGVKITTVVSESGEVIGSESHYESGGTYYFGGGAFSNQSFTLTVDEELPPEIIDKHGIGIGFLVPVTGDFTLAEGDIDDKVLEEAMLGMAVNHAIVFKQADSPELSTFPAGFSCCACTSESTSKDYPLAPAACSDIVITLDNLNELTPCVFGDIDVAELGNDQNGS